MEDLEKMDILVLGNSGAGKSTLIRAISGIQVESGVGEGNTQEVSVYESSTWPFRLIDTKGFEYNIVEQIKTKRQIKSFTKNQQKKENNGIEAVWYCIDGMSKRFFSDNIEMMNKTVSVWKDIPVFAVITKSFSSIEVEENVEAVKKAFTKNKKVNLQKIIPVVAESFAVNEDIVVNPKGIDELCRITLDTYSEAKRISEENLKNMELSQKKYTANATVLGSSAAAAVVGAVPFDFADAFLLVPLETALVKGLFKIYKIENSGTLITSIVGSTAITNIAKATLKLLTGKIPLAGPVLNGLVAGVFVFALGEVVTEVSEQIVLGKLDINKVDEILKYVTDKMQNNAVIGSAIKFVNENFEQFEGKSAKEAFDMVSASIKSVVEIKKVD